VPRYEEIFRSSLRTKPWRYMGDWRYSSRHS